MENFEQSVGKLTKAELGSILYLKENEIRKKKKNELVNLILSKTEDELFRKRLFRKYSSHFALHPSKVEEYLAITSTERKRWTEDGKLIVDHYIDLNKWGKKLKVPMYDAIAVLKISTGIIESWRYEHNLEVHNNRLQTAKKSAETRKRNLEISIDFFENHWKRLLASWFKQNSQLGATLQLSFWTVWINRWAKEFQIRALNARTKKGEYLDKKEQYYGMKNEAIKLLVLSHYTKLSFYRPPSPHKTLHLHFCPLHFELWCSLREFDYLSKWEFFELYKKDIIKCVNCLYEKSNDYYSLYYLSIQKDNLQDFSFSFHIPYPIGKSFLPAKHELPKVGHEEQEGIFRFGRTLLKDEKIIFTEKAVVKNFEESLRKFNLYFSEK
ncbi:hypothetical protein [Bacillus niameyensis]|uniref:hypothetical protein n=1 Tax=Bacillus niameyensis TaxID=1522308 RepID=UPI000782F644|nr:hypothetical protein [Bacillus niameyensis]